MKSRRGTLGWLALLAIVAQVTMVALSGCAQTVAANGVDATEVPVVSEEDKALVAEAVIEPERWTELTFDVSGQVAKVSVEAGDRVEAGALLVRLDTSELELSLASAREQVSSQRAALEALTRGASDVLVSRAARENEQQLAQAEVRLRMRQLQLEQARLEDPTAGVSAAESQIQQLKVQLLEAQARDPAPEVRAAQVELERAKIALDETRDEYNKALDRPWEPQQVRDGWAKQVKQVELNYELAQAKLDGARNARRAHTVSLGALDAQLENAQVQLAQAVAAQKAYTKSLETLGAEIEAARLELEALRAWENPYLDETPREEIAQAEAGLRQAEIAVSQLELQIRKAELRSSLPGTVVEVEVEEGDRVGPGEIVAVLAALDRLRARTVDLTELDIARVVVGQPAVVSVDALPDQEFTGVVKQIGLQAKDYRGDVVYDVVIELTDTEMLAGLRWGMTAVVEIPSN